MADTVNPLFFVFGAILVLTLGFFWWSGNASIASPLVPGDSMMEDKTPETNNGDTLVNPGFPSLPVSLFSFAVSPGSPRAGEDVTITATANASAYEFLNNPAFSFEVGVRQFGNWKTVACSGSPCSVTWENVSTGTLEYRVVRHHPSDTGTHPITEGPFPITVVSTAASGDTLGPKASITHEPFYPPSGGSVLLTALVEDISSVKLVEIWVDTTLEESCTQVVKVSQCATTVSNLEVGDHNYHVKAWDTKDNYTETPSLTFTVK
ncbi:MAG: hypothetical protein AABY11_02035 [archaeon]